MPMEEVIMKNKVDIFEEVLEEPTETDEYIPELVTPPMAPFDTRKDLKYYVVSCDLLNIRSGESKEFDILCQVTKGTKLLADYDLTISNDWVPVKVVETGVEGFCMKQFICEVEDE